MNRKWISLQAKPNAHYSILMGAACLRAVLAKPRTAIMGVVNATPDSFSDGGKYLALDAAIEHAIRLVNQGADILDIGGESTRPGAKPVGAAQELERVIPIIEALRSETSAAISIDTSKPSVMQAALAAGAVMVNDVNGLREPGAIGVCAASKALVCIMHMQGEPRSMQRAPEYDDVVADVSQFLAQRVEDCAAAGVPRADILVDPGIGFGKSLQHNLLLLQAIAKLKRTTACEVLIGVSRKSMIDGILGRPVDQRQAASVGLAVQAALNGAKIVRVHDVAATHDAIRCAEAVALAGS